jgi:hypothetical protein
MMLCADLAVETFLEDMVKHHGTSSSPTILRSSGQPSNVLLGMLPLDSITFIGPP